MRMKNGRFLYRLNMSTTNWCTVSLDDEGNFIQELLVTKMRCSKTNGFNSSAKWGCHWSSAQNGHLRSDQRPARFFNFAQRTRDFKWVYQACDLCNKVHNLGMFSILIYPYKENLYLVLSCNITGKAESNSKKWNSKTWSWKTISVQHNLLTREPIALLDMLPRDVTSSLEQWK